MFNSHNLTIPKEILEASKLNIHKPVYVYYDGDSGSIFLSNKKTSKNCYGCVQINEDLTFSITDNVFKLFNNRTSSAEFAMYVWAGIIHVTQGYSHVAKSKRSKIQIPLEIAQMSSLKLKDKPLYLYSDGNHLVITNKTAFPLCKRCLGIVRLDIENCIEFTDNMDKCFDYENISRNSWCVCQRKWPHHIKGTYTRDYNVSCIII